MKKLERRFSKQPELKKEYVKFIEYAAFGHMEEVYEDSGSSMGFYLPHHCVVKESSTTKLRVVFDGSASSSSGVSLQVLMVGPTVQPDLFSIIFSFRTHVIALSADIAKMYRQMSVHPDDRDLQRIVWRSSPEEQLKDYRLTTVMYETSPASFLATRQLAVRGQEEFPKASDALLSHFYVDDYLGGAPTIEEDKRTREQITALLATAGFPTQKWCSNNNEALEYIPAEERETASLCLLSENDGIKILGIICRPSSDEFQFQVQIKNLHCQPITKRIVLSVVASVYDPLGLLGAIVVKCKIFLQRLWLLQFSWDDPLRSEISSEWKELSSTLPLLSEISIRRNVIPVRDPTRLELHGFCYASEAAYGAVLYAKCVTADSAVSVTLLTPKSSCSHQEANIATARAIWGSSTCKTRT
jgi:hypothetical protein